MTRNIDFLLHFHIIRARRERGRSANARTRLHMVVKTESKRHICCTAGGVGQDRPHNHQCTRRTRAMRADERRQGDDLARRRFSFDIRTSLRASTHASRCKRRAGYMHDSYAKAGPSGQHAESKRARDGFMQCGQCNLVRRCVQSQGRASLGRHGASWLGGSRT